MRLDISSPFLFQLTDMPERYTDDARGPAGGGQEALVLDRSGHMAFHLAPWEVAVVLW